MWTSLVYGRHILWKMTPKPYEHCVYGLSVWLNTKLLKLGVAGLNPIARSVNPCI